jgi:uncharacterized protein (DUF3084 family)
MTGEINSAVTKVALIIAFEEDFKEAITQIDNIIEGLELLKQNLETDEL